MFLLKESQWNAIQNAVQAGSSVIALRLSNATSFDQCFSSYECSSDLVNAYTLLHFTSPSKDNLMRTKLFRKNLTCADVAFYNQFGHSQAANKIEHQYSRVLQTHQCMGRPLNDDFQVRLIGHLNEAANQPNRLHQPTSHFNQAYHPNQPLNQFTHLSQLSQFSNLNQIGHLNLPKIFQRPSGDQAGKNDLSISIVPRRCFDC